MTREHAATSTHRQAVRRDDGELLGHVREDPDGHVPLTAAGSSVQVRCSMSDRVKVAGSDPSWGPVQGTWVAGGDLSLHPAGTTT